MQGDTQGTRARGWWTILALALVASLIAAPAVAQEHDPTEPDRPASSFAAYPGSSSSLAGTAFGVSAVDRLAGATRYDTAVLASQRGWPTTSPHVVIAPGEDHLAAVAAASLAGAVNAPLLLASADGLDDLTAAEVQRLAPGTVHLVGDVPTSVATQVAPADVRTITGANVHELSARTARAAVAAGADPGTVLVASATSLADALAASSLAVGLRHPLLLTGPDGFESWLGTNARALGAGRTIAVGGPAALSDIALSEAPAVSRLSGDDRIATALAVADHARAMGLVGAPVVVSSTTFADSLAGGVLAGNSHRGALLLAGPLGLDDRTAAWLAANNPGWVRVMGGDGAVDPIAVCQLSHGNTRAFACAEEELARQGYHTGAVDGRVDAQTVWMTYALQKVAGIPATGDFGEPEFQAMLRRVEVTPRRPDLEADHIEIDIGRQLVLVVRGGEVVHQLHTSTGKGSTPTVIGTYRVYERRNYRQANHMYRPVFFHRGYAFHGYPSVPLYPASHGCARMYDGDMDFLWNFLYIGEQITTYR